MVHLLHSVGYIFKFHPHQVQRRQEIEQKLEEHQKTEKEEARKERAELWQTRREKQRSIRRLEQKMELVQMVKVFLCSFRLS